MSPRAVRAPSRATWPCDVPEEMYRTNAAWTGLFQDFLSAAAAHRHRSADTLRQSQPQQPRTEPSLAWLFPGAGDAITVRLSRLLCQPGGLSPQLRQCGARFQIVFYGNAISRIDP